MQNFIVEAMGQAKIALDKRTPLIKYDVIYVNIDEVKPKDISNFMKANNIPDNAWFGGKENGYDAFESVCLCYEVPIPTTDADRLKFNRRAFSSIAFKRVHDILIANGYKRIGFNTSLLKDFDDTTIYDMFISGDYDRLVKYYSLSFDKVE